jgi:hypothetical protein
MDVSGIGGVAGFQYVFQQAVARGHQLAHARSGAFESPVHGEAFFHQVADVVAQSFSYRTLGMTMPSR